MQFVGNKTPLYDKGVKLTYLITLKFIEMHSNPLTKEERSVFSMMQYSPLREYLRKKENKTYKRYKSKLKTVERRSEMQYHYNTKHLLTEKAIQLLNT